MNQTLDLKQIKKTEGIWLDFSHKSNTMLIAFGGISGGLSIPIFEFFNITSDVPVKKIFIRDLNQAWYHNGIPNVGKDIDEIAAWLKTKITKQGIKRVVMMGSSAGGYAALLFGTLLEVDQVFAFAPQTFLDSYNRSVYRDKRYQQENTQLYAWLEQNKSKYHYLDLKKILSKSSLKTELNIYYCENTRLDKYHAYHLKDCKNVTLYSYPEGGHSIVKWLRDQGKLTEIISNAVKIKKIKQPIKFYLKQGNQAKKNKCIGEAIYYYKQAIAQNPRVFMAHFLLGKALQQQRQERAAIASYQQALKVAPDHRQAYQVYYHLGLLLAKNNYIKEAIVAYKNAVKRNPQFVPAYIEAANIYAKRGNLSGAIALIERTKKLQPDNFKLRYSLFNLTQSQQNYLNLQSYNYRIVPLGYDCIPRTILTRWGIKHSKAQGELTCPFDLSHHSYDSICELIESDFADYTNSEYLKPIFTEVHDGGTVFVRNIKYHCGFNHERGWHWIENNFELFKTRYQKRIQNFYQYLNDYPVLFVLTTEEALVPIRLVNIIKQKFPHLFFKILVINLGEKHEVQNQIPEEVLLYHIPHQTVNKQWSLPKFYMSSAGMEFEQQIATAAKRTIVQHFKPVKKTSNFITVGSCLSYVIGCHYRRISNNTANCIASIRHNRVDKIINSYLHKTIPELSDQYIDKLDFDRNNFDLVDILDNQFSSRKLGKTCLNSQTLSLINVIDNQSIDLVIYDSFCELLFKLLYLKGSQESLFLNIKDYRNWQEFFELESQRLSIEQIVKYYVEVVKFFQSKNRQTKVVFINFPFFHHHSETVRQRTQQLNQAIRENQYLVSQAYLIPAVPIPETYLHDLTHFKYANDRNLYDDYAAIIKSIADGYFTPLEWYKLVDSTQENLLSTIIDLYAHPGYQKPIYTMND